jgi:hypothetical protein
LDAWQSQAYNKNWMIGKANPTILLDNCIQLSNKNWWEQSLLCDSSIFILLILRINKIKN